jgi:hypothetical protein
MRSRDRLQQEHHNSLCFEHTRRAASASMAAVRPPVQMASAAKSIVIVQGEFLFTLPRTFNSRVTLRGTQGFRFDPSLGDGSFPAAQCGESQTACLPGTTVSVLGLWNGLDVLGTVVWRGQTFPPVPTRNSIRSPD